MNPSPLAERIVGALLPAEAREHVLGDLAERYQSPAQYAADAALTLPYVVFSHLRRTVDPIRIAIELSALYLTMAFCAWWLQGSDYLLEADVTIRLAFAALGTFVAVRFRPPAYRIWALVLGLMLIRLANLPSQIPYGGGAIGIMLLLLLHLLIAPGGPTRPVRG